MEFATPWALLLLLLIPLVCVLRRVWWSEPTIRFSSSGNFTGCPTSWRLKLRKLPFWMRLLVLALLIVALARPRQGIEKIIDHSKGVAIEMVLDRSGSMAEKMMLDGQAADRLTVAKQVFNNFVMGDKHDDLKGRKNDLIGLITFARYADTICPLTLGHEMLPEFLEQIKLVEQRSEENRTAIGDALALAAARLYNAEKEIARKQKEDPQEKGFSIKSKVIILLTDGQDNASRTGVGEAAELCKKWGIKIYAIGVGGDNNSGYMNTPFGRIAMPLPSSGVDERMLEYLAKTTGGRFYMADNEESLVRVYEEIDQLEKTEIQAVRHVDYAEKFMPFALAALVVIGLEVLLRSTILRTLP